jgi:hypothetical protein
VKGKIVALVAALALAGCTSIGPGGQMQRDATGNALWSFLIPGAGQFMNGETGKGALMLGLNVLSVGGALRSETLEEAQTWLTVGLVVEIWSTADAYSSANRLNRERPLGIYRSQAPAEPKGTPITVCLDLVNKRLLTSVSYRF